MNMLNVLFGVCMKTWTRWSLSLQFRALVYGNSWKRHLLLQSWKLEVDSGKINLVWGSRMRQTTKLQFAFREPHSASLQWRGPGNWVFHGNTTDLWKCSTPKTAYVFLLERYLLLLVKGNALKTIIQKPISLASSMWHAAATVTDICVLNKSFLTQNTLYCCSII